MTAPGKDVVVLLHGILRGKLDMEPLAFYLRQHGYETINIDYPSRQMELDSLSDYIHRQLALSPAFNSAGAIHFVTHSMGGLVARYYIYAHRPENLGRVVMLAPPNSGSEFADFMTDYETLKPVYEKIFGPAGRQMKTGHQHAAGAIDYPLGIIAGSASINPLAPWVLTGEHDGIVSVERTKIEGMTDHVILPVTHTLMMFNPSVMQQVSHFLKNEKFLKP